MTVELITGQGSTDHINSEDIGAYQAYTFGTGCYVLNGCQCSVVDANTVRIAKGELLIEGRHVRVKGSEDISIRSGASGQKRNDLIVVRYSKDQSSIEDAPLVVVPGTATAGTASDPAYVIGSILDEDVEAEYPLYRIPIDGLTVGSPALLMERMVPYSEAWKKMYPVGAVYISYVSTSPASLFGGTWTPITGRFPYFNAGTSVGGSNTHTLTVNEMPRHSHDIKMSGQDRYAGIWLSNASEGSLWSIVSPTLKEHLDSGRAPYLYNTNSGGGKAHNNMPAYQTLYAWRRTA